jgi:hypothetical protein
LCHPALFNDEDLWRGMKRVVFEPNRESLWARIRNRIPPFMRGLRTERVDEAIEVLSLDVEEYPGASNPYDSLGEAFMVAGALEQ